MGDEVRKHLDDLHDRLGDLDEAARAEADELREHVRRFEPESSPSEEEHLAFVARLRKAALRFESSHPELSSEIARVIDSLTAAGI